MMVNNPLISVIVPVYNVEPYLEKCVQSICRQTYKNLEIILVDDGSTDKSGQMCDEFALNDSRIVVYHQKNTGQAGARNYAISIAKGEYIGFVDSDDWVADDMYEVLLTSLQKNDADISMCGRFSVRGDVIKESPLFHLDNETIMDNREAVKRFLTYKAIDSSMWDKLYKKELFNGVTLPLGYICEDVPAVYMLLAKAKRVVHCAKPLYYVLIRSGSTSRSTFSHKTMGLYYNFKPVYDLCQRDFGEFENECDYFFLKNLLVLAYRIAIASPIPNERKEINALIRKNKKTIFENKYLKKSYKLFALTIVLRIERLAMKLCTMFGIRIGL